MALYGTSVDATSSSASSAATAAAPSPRASASQSSSSVTIPADDDDDSDQRRRLLGDRRGAAKMTLPEVLYAYDLTLAQLAFQKFGRAKAARVGWELLSHTGDGILWFLMVLPVVAVMWSLGLLDDASQASKTVFVVFYTCNFVDIIAIIVMKLLFKRARPPHHHNDGRFVGPDQHSFPSGHATRCWCIVAFVLDLAHRHPATARAFFRVSPDVLRVLILLWALAISFSRVALGRHYPSDVVAGACIGLFGLYPIAVFVVRHFTTLTDF